MISCHKFRIVRIDIVFLHVVFMQKDLQEVQHDNTYRKENEGAQLRETEDQI